MLFAEHIVDKGTEFGRWDMQISRIAYFPRTAVGMSRCQCDDRSARVEGGTCIVLTQHFTEAFNIS